MLSLVDANNFYVSCERAFNPSLVGKPVVVLSNNDGSVVARSDEVKKMGLSMATPFFQHRELIETHNVKVFSSNYTLYGDMSARLMSLLGRFVPDIEVNSIDEAWLDLSGCEGLYPDLLSTAREIRATVKQWIRIPVSIGMAPTKSLTKVANWYAKRVAEHEGVLMLETADQIQAALADFDVGELWGVGHRYASLLKRNGIKTAAQFAACPDDWIQQHMTVNGLRLAYELRGTPCRLLVIDPPAKKSIGAAPSFGRLVPDQQTIEKALTTYIGRVSEKLRRQKSLASALTVFLHTNRFRRSPNGEPAKQYSNSRTVILPHPSSSTAELNRYALAALNSVFKFGYQYQKVGVILSGLVPGDYRQQSCLCDGPDERLTNLYKVVDKINTKHGRDRVRLANQDFNPDWQMKQQWLSPCYTTRWKDIIQVK